MAADPSAATDESNEYAAHAVETTSKPGDVTSQLDSPRLHPQAPSGVRLDKLQDQILDVGPAHDERASLKCSG